MDATTSFVYLTDNLPQWIEQAKDLSAHASKKHDDYAAEYKRRLAQLKPKKERTLSMSSIHTNRDKPVQSPPQIIEPLSDPTPEPSTPNALHISPFEAGNKYLLAQAQRKRKLGSSIRSGASGPQKFRSKHMVVIYYDSYLQAQLDTLVKSIGGARNNLRKGKLSRSAKIGFQLPCFRTGPEYSSWDVPVSDGYKKAPTSPSSLLTDPKIQFATPTPTCNEAFTSADKHLEAAQSLCETAAHQVLRDGDCTIELTNVVTKFEAILELATATVAQLREEDADSKEAEEEEEAVEVEQPQPNSVTAPSADSASSPPSMTYSSISKLIPSLNEKTDYPPPRAVTIPSGGVTEIEVDEDSDQGSLVVDISKFRSTRNTRSQGLRT